MEKISIYEDLSYGETAPKLKVLLNTNSIEEIRITFKSGQIMKEHKAAHPIVVNVIEGEIEFKINEEVFILPKGMLIRVDTNILHELKATVDSILRLSINKAG